MQVGPGQRRRGVREVPDRGEAAVDRAAATPRSAARPGRRASGGPGSSACARCDHTATTSARALGLRPSRRRRAGPASRRRRRRCGPGPVSILRCTPGGPPGPARAVEHAGQVRARRHRQVDPRGDGGREVLVGQVQPGQHRARRSPRRAARAPPRACRRPARWHRPSSAARATGTAPCPYPSALTTAISRGPGRRGGEHARRCAAPRRGRPPPRRAVPASAIEAVRSAMPHPSIRRPTACRRRERPARSAAASSTRRGCPVQRRSRGPSTRRSRGAARTTRIAAGIAPWIADAGAGAPSAASSAARACRNAAQPAAHHGSSPAASSAPTIPVSTSPDPAVAAHDVVDGCTSARPSGSATTVALPLSSTVTPQRRRGPARRRDPVGPHLAGHPGELPVVRSDHHRPARDGGAQVRRAGRAA